MNHCVLFGVRNTLLLLQFIKKQLFNLNECKLTWLTLFLNAWFFKVTSATIELLQLYTMCMVFYLKIEMISLQEYISLIEAIYFYLNEDDLKYLGLLLHSLFSFIGATSYNLYNTIQELLLLCA